ncbi:hypothetical protein STVIR_1820 [Streptomyces viridochromogenes Tue57]|uniref:Uncharacterized protein n=1 Tax=Streptomyces viridochromogenes Tue57 TaxID=1160705 RepID=L8PL42_STRVR|nr:hypothetical protein STVIR_1820 [Streptomyces viridochromogenes Tue57]
MAREEQARGEQYCRQPGAKRGHVCLLSFCYGHHRARGRGRLIPGDAWLPCAVCFAAVTARLSPEWGGRGVGADRAVVDASGVSVSTAGEVEPPCPTPCPPR